MLQHYNFGVSCIFHLKTHVVTARNHADVTEASPSSLDHQKREPSFVQYINNRNFDIDPLCDIEDGDADVSDAGDLGPEGVKFIPKKSSPVEAPVVAVGNELSGTTTLYRVHTLEEQ